MPTLPPARSDIPFETRAAQIIHRAQLVGEASAAQLEMSRRQPGSRLLRSVGSSTLEDVWRILCRHRWAPAQRLERAEAAVRAVTHAPERHEPTEAETRERRLWQYEGVHFAVAAEREGMPAITLWKLRHRSGRDPMWGHEVAAVVAVATVEGPAVTLDTTSELI